MCHRGSGAGYAVSPIPVGRADKPLTLVGRIPNDVHSYMIVEVLCIECSEDPS